MPGNLTTSFYQGVTYLFDPLHYFWEKDSTQRKVGGALVVFFILALGMIELKRIGLLPGFLVRHIPSSHYMAINLAFTLVLVLEVVSLIFTLPCSISKAVGKQFEILALILLRNSFKELVNFPTPITLEGHTDALLNIVSDGVGALVIFAVLGIYKGIQQTAEDETKRGEVLFKFVAAKKSVALILVGAFLCMGLYNTWQFIAGGKLIEFFHDFYTLLIFSDILLVLISQRFFPAFNAVFRNSGFALVTLLIRLALTASTYYAALIGIGAAVYAVLLTIVYNTYYIGGVIRAGKS